MKRKAQGDPEQRVKKRKTQGDPEQELENSPLEAQPKHTALFYPVAQFNIPNERELGIMSDKDALHSVCIVLTELYNEIFSILENNGTFAVSLGFCNISVAQFSIFKGIQIREGQLTTLALTNMHQILKQTNPEKVAQLIDSPPNGSNFSSAIKTAEEDLKNSLLSLLKGAHKIILSGIRNDYQYNFMQNILDQQKNKEIKFRETFPSLSKQEELDHFNLFVSNKKYSTELDISDVCRSSYFHVKAIDSKNTSISNTIIEGCRANPKLKVKYCGQQTTTFNEYKTYELLIEFAKERVDQNLTYLRVKELLPIYQCLTYFELPKEIIKYIIQDYSMPLRDKTINYPLDHGFIVPLLGWEELSGDTVPLSGAEKTGE